MCVTTRPGFLAMIIRNFSDVLLMLCTVCSRAVEPRAPSLSETAKNRAVKTESIAVLLMVQARTGTS